MKAILIDDENPALYHLEKLLQEDGRIEVKGKYLSAAAGLQHLSKETVDVVFIDIDMPQMNGLEAAEHILQVSDCQIVYVTAYSHYALEAFEIHALDYLLKPVSPDRFRKTVDRICKNKLPVTTVEEQPSPKIFCFKRLSILTEDEHSKKLKWRTMKTQELFAFLLHQQGEWIQKETLLDTIWPDFFPEKAITHLHTSIYQVRKVLKEWGIKDSIEFAHDSYRFQLSSPTDADLFEKLSAEIKPPTTEQQLLRLDSIIALYRGDYLADYDYIWANSRRSILLNRYIKLNLSAASYEIDQGKIEHALQRLLLLQEKDPFSEEICLMTLKAYVEHHNYSGARAHFQAFQAALKDELGIMPEQELIDFYINLARR